MYAMISPKHEADVTSPELQSTPSKILGPIFGKQKNRQGPVKVRRRVCWTENILSSGLLSYHLFGLQFS